MRTLLSSEAFCSTRTALFAPALAVLVLASGCGVSDDSVSATSGAGASGGAGNGGAMGLAGAAGSAANKGGAAGKPSGGGGGATGGSSNGGSAGTKDSGGAGGETAGGAAGSTAGGTAAGGAAGSASGGTAGSATAGSAGAAQGGTSSAGSAGQSGAGQSGAPQGGSAGAAAGQGGASTGGNGGTAGAGGGIGCCTNDASDCPSSANDCVNGVCVAPPPSGGCWEDSACGPGNTCEGEYVCPCGAACVGLVNQPGKCTPLAAGCCQTDDDCSKGGKPSACVNGSCKEAPPLGACWDGSDCKTGQTCEGESVCPCGANCLVADTLGKCVDGPPGPGCCKDDAGCDPQTECTSGVCKAIPPTGACWDDGDCKVGERCDGETLCACGAACPAIPDSPGKCVPSGSTGCCEKDAQCANAGEACIEGVCKPKPAAGLCWRSDQCASGLVCEGADVCSCFTDVVCPGPDAPGKCVKPANGCCKVDADCPTPGASCVNGTCVDAPKPGQCWDDSDCTKAQTCEGELVCPCGALCGPLANRPGTCTATGAKVCCKDDAGCPDTDECVLSGGIGVCKPIPQPSQAGSCWMDGDCGAGVCKGAQVCGCAQNCLLPDQLGKCL